MPSAVTVHYPFHPLHHHSLEVVTWPREPHSAVTVRDPDGTTLKIPLWMLEPPASQLHLSDQVELTASVLLALVALIEQCSKVTATTQPEHPDATDNPRSRRRARPPTSAEDGTRAPN